MEEIQSKPKKKGLTPLGYIVFTILITFCIYALVNFFIGGIPWQIVLAAVVLALVVYTLK
jgi:hypothetical protein